MFKSKQVVPAPASVPAGPPPLAQVFNGASGASEYAKGMFQDVIDELVEANARFDEVEIRATSEIDSLTSLRDEATARRRENTTTITNLQALLGQ